MIEEPSNIFGMVSHTDSISNIFQNYINFPTKIPLLFPRRYHVPESPRWLLENGKIDELIKVITIAARWNKIELPAGYEKTLHQPEQTLTVSFLKMFNAKYCRTTLLMIVVWYALILIYFGLTLHLAHLGGDIYITTVSQFK